jgi:hypothetical protein
LPCILVTPCPKDNYEISNSCRRSDIPGVRWARNPYSTMAGFRNVTSPTRPT